MEQNQSRIVNVRKTDTGEICAVKLDTGEEMTLQDAIVRAEQGYIDGVIVSTDRAGNKCLHSKRGQPNYKLSNLPSF